MFSQILLLFVGLAMIVFGSDWVVDGASSLAKRFKVSDFIIGMTIVGMGTSLPEFVVSMIGVVEHNSEIAIGNVFGSNVFNTLLIIGVTSLILPIRTTTQNRLLDIPINGFACFLVAFLGVIFGTINFWCGIFLLACFSGYLAYCLKSGKEEKVEEVNTGKAWKSILITILGLSMLSFGGKMFVDSAKNIAEILKVSDKVIAITVLALGTSLPELATCVTAAIKGKDELALGNIIGSNIFNALLILGAASLFQPLSFENITTLDCIALTGSSVILYISSGFSERISRFSGILMVLMYILYIGALITT